MGIRLTLHEINFRLYWPIAIFSAPRKYNHTINVFTFSVPFALCLFTYSGVQHILCCVFVFLHLVCPMLPVSLDFPSLVASSVFSNVYILHYKNEYCKDFWIFKILHLNSKYHTTKNELRLWVFKGRSSTIFPLSRAVKLISGEKPQATTNLPNVTR
jgi:hypothetical protein